ncbi:unnamed protein product [Protopolystoma xenopodis]|uniref:Uncharacterized protein n=1 Tax=Protopolystoma xenopodis TaxID=117903 RepID=A0A448WMA2_9PLAT|nr:unnamed protein product [Protopolystoma xenopodis]
MECYVNWLTDLNSYSLESQKWKNLKLFYVPSNVLRPPPDFGGQSGCFLPPSSTSPDLLVLFGGYCKRRRVCINKVVIVAPTLGQWCFAKIEGENEDENGIKLPAPSESDENLLLGRSAVWNNTDQSNCQSRTSQYPDSESCLSVRPLGRYGHSACPLNENQIVIVGGNTEPPQSLLSSVATDLHPHHQGRRFDEHRNAAIAEPNGEGRPSENSLPIINGTPACDIWILTRIPQETGKSWTTACWFWTKVVCSYSGSGCPPPDFYYSISLPVLSPLSGSGSSLFKSNYDINYPEQQQKEQLQKQSSLSCSTNSPSNTVTIDCGSSNVRLFVLSGATQTMIDEAGKQRRLRWRRELALDRACRSTAQRQVAANSVTNVGEGDAISVYSADSMPIATSPFASPFRGSSKQKLNALDSPQSLPNIDSSSTSQCNTGSEANFNLGVLYRHGGYPDTPASPISSSSGNYFASTFYLLAFIVHF